MSVLQGCKTDDWMDWKVQNQLLLEANKQKNGIQVTESGLQYRVIADPDPHAAKPHSRSAVICNYTLKLPVNGHVIESSPAQTFLMGSVIAGFAEGLHKIHVNGIIEMWIPYDLGYGEDGTGNEGTANYIPPFSTLYFKVQLLDSNADK